MANFEPKWDLKADANTIKEGQELYIRLFLSKNRPQDVINSEYVLPENTNLVLSFDINGSGDTLEERDFILSVGEDINNLIPIADALTGVDTNLGRHVVQFTTTSYDLGSNIEIPVYYIKVNCVSDGIWDGSEVLTFIVNSMRTITRQDGQIVSQDDAGLLGVNTQILTYDTSGEIWVTPDLTVHDNQLYTIGGLPYGAESRLFAQAFGRSRPYSQTIDASMDQSNRVFMPAYQLMTLTEAELPARNITTAATILNPVSTSVLEEIEVNVKNITNTYVKSGLKFNNNGQLVQTFLYDSDPVDGYFKLKIVSLKDFYNTPGDAYFIGKRFRAYQTWIAPMSDSDLGTFYPQPTPGHIYQLRDTRVYPYVVKEVDIAGVSKSLFEPEAWNDLGVFDEAQGSGIIGEERIFRILINDSTGTGIDFETDANLGQIHIGEYFGHSVYPKIVASGSDLITYEINHITSPNDIRKYNIDLSADGYMIGTAYATSADFNQNDEIKLLFDVIATGKDGKSTTKEFNITLVRGMSDNFISADVCPSVNMERDWFKMISTEAFSTAKYYRSSDPRYGIKRVPRMLLKENFVDPSHTWVSIDDTKQKLRANIINTTTGAPVPYGPFKFTVGNYKVRSALDNSGNVIYDILYREIFPYGSTIDASTNPIKYMDYNSTIISEVFGLRNNIFNILGQDIRNIEVEPDDFNNRAVVVPAINGLTPEMIDTVPRFMVHPYEDTGVKAGYIPVIPVAYLMPGTGEALYYKLVQNNEHKTLLNTVYEIQNIEFLYFVQEFDTYIRDNFNIPLIGKSLFQ